MLKKLVFVILFTSLILSCTNKDDGSVQNAFYELNNLEKEYSSDDKTIINESSRNNGSVALFKKYEIKLIIVQFKWFN